MLSPLAQIIQDVRWSLISNKTITAWSVLNVKYFWFPYLAIIVVFSVGYFIFEKMAAKFAEEV
jgi:ABC-2 type transport system permease protein